MKYLIIINILIISLLINFNGCLDIYENDSPKTIIVDINNVYEYQRIQDAINASFENDTIYILNGIYNENLIINKDINLIGENKTNTIIDGNGIGDVIFISESSSVNISGFTIRNSGNGSPDKDCGIDIRSTSNVINNNIILDNNNGIFQYFSTYNNISNNQIINCSEYGINVFSNSNYNKIYSNIFSSNNCSIRIKGSKHNEVSRNTIHSNQRGIFFCCGANENIVYNNIFINNTLWHAKDTVGGNFWDYEDVGNYWDDYNSTLDQFYLISYKGIDNYPIKNLSDMKWLDKFF